MTSNEEKDRLIEVYDREEYKRAEDRVDRDVIRFTGNAAEECWHLAKSHLRQKALEEGLSYSDYEERLEQAASILYDAQVALQINALLEQQLNSGFIWAHQSQEAIDAYGIDDPADIHRANLLEAAAAYESKPKLHNPYMDWLFLDSLTYAEYSGFKETVANGSWGKTPNYAWAFSGRNPRKAQLIKIVAFVIRWLALPALLLFIGNFWLLLAYGVYLFLRFLRNIWRVYALYKADKLMVLMRRAYAQCTPPTINPNELKLAVHQARDEGTVYDGALFNILDRVCREHPDGLYPFVRSSS